MAQEKDFELLDDYIANRLNAEERSSFEQRLKKDPELQKEYSIQQELVQSIRQARKSELKQMLGNIPVSSIPSGSSALTKILVGTAITVVVGTGLYLVSQREQPIETPEVILPETPLTEEPAEVPEMQDAPEEVESPVEHEQTPAGPGERQPAEEHRPAPLKSPAPGKKTKEDSTPKKPVDVFDPTAEEEAASEAIGKANTTAKAVEENKTGLLVETESNDKKHSFHYQFKAGKLILYGPFEKNLYEILEFFSDEKRTVFLFYNENFYLLKEDSSKIKPLTSIQDPALLKKLKEYRGNN